MKVIHSYRAHDSYLMQHGNKETGAQSSKEADEKIFFDEGEGSDRVRVELVRDREWWVATLLDAQGEAQGSVRLRYKTDENDSGEDIVKSMGSDIIKHIQAARGLPETAPKSVPDADSTKTTDGSPQEGGQDKGCEDETTDAPVQRKEFYLHVTGRLGMRISPDDEPTSLTIDEIQGDGFAARWNETADAAVKIRPGDQIIAINGNYNLDAVDMLKLIKQSSQDNGNVTLTVRPPPPVDPVS